MAYKINSYFSVLLITIAGASLLIIHVATASTFEATLYNTEAISTSLLK